jgi:hypothetical protein
VRSMFFKTFHVLCREHLKVSYLEGRGSVWLDVHKSMHHDTIMKVTNKMQLYRLIYYS